MTYPAVVASLPRMGGRRTPMFSLKRVGEDCQCQVNRVDGLTCSAEGFRWAPGDPVAKFGAGQR